MNQMAIYPGCSLEGTAAGFEVSLTRVLDVLGIDHKVLEDWNCCGATSAHAMDHELYLGLAMRNLSLAEEQGFREVLTPCAACYHRLASAGFELSHDADLCAQIKSSTGLDYEGTVRVRNVLDFLAHVISPIKMSDKVVKPLTGMKVACYYGCLNTRIPRMKSFDDVDYPMTMDRIIEALGGTAIDWGYKTECCGASLFVTSEPTARRLVAKILKDATARGADCIAVVCPLCHNNLDTKQSEIRSEYGIDKPLPVLFISQLMGLAFGIEAKELRLDDGFVPIHSLGAIHYD